MKKRILLLGLFIALVGIFVAYKIYNKPFNDMSSAKADYSMEAQALLAEFKTDEAKANGDFVNKTIVVSGSVMEVSNTDGDAPSIVLDAGDPMEGVRCKLDFAPNAKHKRTEFQVGEKVTFKGVCAGYLELSGVDLTRCVEQ